MLPTQLSALTQGRSFVALGNRMTIEVSAAETRGRSSTLRMSIQPGGGPLAHIHTREDETYVITRGHFRFWRGKSIVDAPTGTVVFLPRDEAHQFLNIGARTGELTLTMVPGNLEQFFTELARRHLAMPKDVAAIVRLSAAYGIRYVAPLNVRHK